MEVLGVAVGLPVPFPEPEADATNPSAGGRTLVPCLRLGWVAWVGRGGMILYKTAVGEGGE